MARNSYGRGGYSNYNRGYDNGGYDNRGYDNGGYSRRSNRGYSSNRGGSGKKKSGCSAGVTRETNKPYVQGWKYDRRNGLRKFIAGPYSKTQTVKSERGLEWENWCLKVTFSDGRSQLFNCMYDVLNRRVICKELGFVMNPRGGPGGFVGSFVNKGR